MQKASRFVMEDGKLKYLGEVKRPASFSPDPTVDHVMSNLPDTDQQQRVEGILRESGEEFARLRQEMRPRFQAIRGRTRDQIRGVLDPEQRARFEVVAEEWDRRAAERWGWRPQAPDSEKSKAP